MLRVLVGLLPWTAGSLIALAVFAVPFWRGQIYIGNDLGLLALPVRHFYSWCLAHGQSPLWFPNIYCGVYLGQADIFHPLLWLAYRLLPLPAAFNLELLSSYPFLFAGCALFFRKWVRVEAALCGAFVFTFSGFNTLHFIHMSMVKTVAHIPWLLLCVHEASTAGGRRRLAAECGLWLMTASQLLSGFPQCVLYSLYLEAFYAFFLWRLGRMSPGAVARIAAAKLLALPTAAVQLLPMWDAVSHSARADTNAQFRGYGSLHPLQLWQWASPYLYEGRVLASTRIHEGTWEFGLYNGAFSTLAFLWLFLNRKSLKEHRAPALACGGLAVFSLLLAFGRFVPGFEWFSRLPPLSLFRMPSRAIVLLHFALAGAAALSYQLIADSREKEPWDWRRAWPLFLPAALAAGFVCFAQATTGELNHGVRPWPVAWIGPASLLIFAYLLLLARRRPAVLIALAAAAIVEQGAFGLSFIRSSPAHTLQSYAALMHAKDNPPPPDGRIASTRNNVLAMLGYSLVDGYMGLEPARSLDYNAAEARRLAAAGWERDAGVWKRVRNPLPRVRFRSLRGRARIASEAPGAVEVLTEAPSSQPLVFAESFHEGWKAFVDGRPIPVTRADGDFMGAVVPAGTHRVRFEFSPRSFRFGLLLSALGLFLSSLYFLGRLLIAGPRN